MMNDIKKWNKQKCINFLSENWGFRGYNGSGITKNKNDRNIEKLRIEVINQMNIIKQLN
jgi:hypothetical protein